MLRAEQTKDLWVYRVELAAEMYLSLSCLLCYIFSVYFVFIGFLWDRSRWLSVVSAYPHRKKTWVYVCSIGYSKFYIEFSEIRPSIFKARVNRYCLSPLTQSLHNLDRRNQRALLLIIINHSLTSATIWYNHLLVCANLHVPVAASSRSREINQTSLIIPEG